MDVEIRTGTASILITHDCEYERLAALSQEQSAAVADAARKVVRKVQEESFEMDVEAEMNYYHFQHSNSMRWMVQFKWHSEECKEMLKCSRDETPERPKVRGRSETRCHTISSRRTPECSLVRGYSALAQCPDSLKRERMPAPQTSGPTCTQSPAQKNT